MHVDAVGFVWGSLLPGAEKSWHRKAVTEKQVTVMEIELEYERTYAIDRDTVRSGGRFSRIDQADHEVYKRANEIDRCGCG